MERATIIQQAKKEIMEIKLSTPQITFVVKRSKRKVIALMTDQYGRVESRASAMCQPGDCFNEFVGKAIAMRRLLGLPEVEEYINIPEPSEVKIGDIVQYGESVHVYAPWGFVVRGEIFESNYISGRLNHLEYAEKMGKVTVVDDTNYIEEHDFVDIVPESPRYYGCYNGKENDCDGSCQGAADCPMAEYLKGVLRERPTKKEMLAHIKNEKKVSKEFRKLMDTIDIFEIIKEAE